MNKQISSRYHQRLKKDIIIYTEDEELAFYNILFGINGVIHSDVTQVSRFSFELSVTFSDKGIKTIYPRVVYDSFFEFSG